MQMNDYMWKLEELTMLADEHLRKLGLQDIVNTFLAGHEAEAAVETVYTEWRKSLKVYVDKMPDVAHESTGKILENLKKGQSIFVKTVFLYFKQSLIDTASKLTEYVSIEDVYNMNFPPFFKVNDLWLKTLSDKAQKMVDAIDMRMKAYIAEKAFLTLKTKAQVDKLFDVLNDEPNSFDLLVLVDTQLSIRALNAMLLAGFDSMTGMSGLY